MTEYTSALIPAVHCEVCDWGPCKYMKGFGGILTKACVCPKEETMREVRERVAREPRKLFSFDELETIT